MRIFRGLAGLGVVLVAATALVAVPRMAVASEDSLTLPGGGATVALGPNAVLRIDGRLQFDTRCDTDNGGINDWAYAASDIYLMGYVPMEGDELQDVSGFPSTIVQGGSEFIDEIIGVTAPSGTLEAGTYTIIFDTCQDGIYEPGEDSLYSNAVHVQFPAEMPPVDAALVALKTNAQTEWGRWKDIGKLFDSLINVDKIAGCGEKDVGDCLDLVQIWADSDYIKDWAETAGDLLQQGDCVGGDPSACFGLLAEYWGMDSDSIRDKLFGGVKSLIANQAKSFYGLYADPPRDDFLTPTSAVIDLPIPGVQGGGSILDATANLGTALQREVALRTAFTTAVERYQGAVAAGDPVAAAAQLRSASSLASALAEAQPVTAAATTTFFDAVEATIPNFDSLASDAKATIDRQFNGGFTPAEDRTLRNGGNGTGQRGAYLSAKRQALGGIETAVLENLGPITDLVGDQASEAAALNDAAADLNDVADAIISSGSSSPQAGQLSAIPTLSITSPVTGTVGSPVTFHAAASSGATLSWDLDGDGKFDDGTGATATATYAQSGHRFVAARAIGIHGATVTAHGVVDITATNAPPVIDSALPQVSGKPSATGVVGHGTTFTVTAHDPESEALRYSWWVDGTKVSGASGSSLVLTPTAGDRGGHTVFVTVQDPHPGNLAQQAWRWRVSDVDADHDGWADNSVADCDDSDGDVHPGRLEQLFNGKDDDCNAATPDEGTDLGTGGQLWSWGSGWANPTGNDGIPRPYAPQAGEIKSVTDAYSGVWWLNKSGNVYGYGGYWVVTGANPSTGAVYGTGSESGVLGGVAEITADDSEFKYARLSDGRVVSWGVEGNRPGALGAGTPLWSRNYPDFVLGPDTDSDGSPDPLENVAHVWSLQGAGIALTTDGDIYQWGPRRCANTGYPEDTPVSTVAVKEPALTSALQGLVQASGAAASLAGTTAFRTADGSVYGCGADRINGGTATYEKLERFAPFGPDNPAVDIAVYRNSFMAVTADGKVWAYNWEDDVAQLPGCTPTLCPRGKWHVLPLPADWFVVGVSIGGDYQLRLADGRLMTWSGENTNGSLGHGDPPAVPAPVAIDGFVIDNASSVWNGYAVVLPNAAIQDSGWVAPQPAVQVSAVGATGPEGGHATAGITLSQPATGDLAVSWEFNGASGTSTVLQGDTAVEVPLALPDADGVWGADRHLTFTITNVTSNAVIADENADVLVTDVDSPPTVTMTPDAVAEGDGALTGATVTVKLSAAAAVDLGFTVTSANGTAVEGTDYKAVHTRVIIPAGDRSATVPLVVLGNGVPQVDRDLSLSATSDNRAVAGATQRVTITDDDPIVVRVTSKLSAGGSNVPVLFDVPNLPVGETVTIHWATADGSATAPTDYTAGAGTVTLTGGPTLVGGAGRGTARVVAAAPAASGAASIATNAVPVAGADPQVHWLSVNLTADGTARTVIMPASVAVGVVQAAEDEPDPSVTPSAGPSSEPQAGSEPTGGGLSGTGANVVGSVVAATVLLLVGFLLRRRRHE